MRRPVMWLLREFDAKMGIGASFRIENLPGLMVVPPDHRCNFWWLPIEPHLAEQSSEQP